MYVCMARIYYSGFSVNKAVRFHPNGTNRTMNRFHGAIKSGEIRSSPIYLTLVTLLAFPLAFFRHRGLLSLFLSGQVLETTAVRYWPWMKLLSFLATCSRKEDLLFILKEDKQRFRHRLTDIYLFFVTVLVWAWVSAMHISKMKKERKILGFQGCHRLWLWATNENFKPAGFIEEYTYIYIYTYMLYIVIVVYYLIETRWCAVV